jgi:hypothetical protein
MSARIITDHVFPPIPMRHCNWCAYYEGTEESGPLGWGATESEAVTDLQENFDATDFDARR